MVYIKYHIPRYPRPLNSTSVVDTWLGWPAPKQDTSVEPRSTVGCVGISFSYGQGHQTLSLGLDWIPWIYHTGPPFRMSASVDRVLHRQSTIQLRRRPIVSPVGSLPSVQVHSWGSSTARPRSVSSTEHHTRHFSCRRFSCRRLCRS